jgi:ATP-binding cassette subfamily A (ABC1) protein 3
MLRNQTNNNNATIAHLSIPMTSDVYIQDDFSIVMNELLGFVMVLMYILPIHRTVGRIVTEKENRVKDAMRMMGLSDFAYWLSWFLYYLMVSTIISLCCTIILCTKVFPHSNWGLIFLFFWLYGISLFGFCMLVSPFFYKARVASIVSSLVFFFTFFLG